MRNLLSSVSAAVLMAAVATINLPALADSAAQSPVLTLVGGSPARSGQAASSGSASGNGNSPSAPAMKRVPVEENGKDVWTSERFKAAAPMPLPTSDTPIPMVADDFSVAEPVKVKVTESRGPIVKVKPDLDNPLFEPDPLRPAKHTEDGVEPNNYGARGAQFSSSRLFPDGAYLSFPFRAIGKLFFDEPGQGAFVCSASVLRSRIVLTAGHCVHSGNGSPSGWHTNYRFVPAFDNGKAPYRQWTVNTVVTTNQWFNGGGRVPNAQDVALFEMNDLVINGVVRRIGDVTGYLGYATGKLAANHAHLIGYPGSLDNGLKMHWVASQSFAAGGTNTIVYGSDMTGGSSGGPWIQNLGIPSVGQTYGLNRAPNVVIGVTSYGPTDPTQLTQGSSILNASFLSILNTICNNRVGNC